MKTHLLHWNALLSWGQTVLQWLFNKVHCPHIPNVTKILFSVVLLKEILVEFYGCIQYTNTVCTVHWMSVCVSLCLFSLFPLLPDLGQSIFYTTTCLLPFLSDDILSTLPYTMISTLATFPPFLHKDIIEYLSTSFLPMAICEYDLSQDKWKIIIYNTYKNTNSH